MGLMRKALFLATGGLSGRVFKDSSQKQRTAKASGKAKASDRRARSNKQPRTVRPKPQAARRRRTQTVRKPVAAKADADGSGNGTATELERLAKLYAHGALSDEEFAAAKAKILGTDLAPQGSRTSPATFPAVEANVAAARHLADVAGHGRGTSVTTLSSD